MMTSTYLFSVQEIRINLKKLLVQKQTNKVVGNHIFLALVLDVKIFFFKPNVDNLNKYKWVN